MTTTQTQLRRDTATNLAAATPAAGEPGYDTTNKRLLVGDGTTQGGIPHVSAADAQKQSFTYPSVGGTGDAITFTNTFPKSSLVAGQKGTFKAGAANTGAVTITEDGLTTKNLKKVSSGGIVALDAGDIVAGGMYDYTYDGTQYQIIGGIDASSGALPAAVTATLGGNTSVVMTVDFTTYEAYLVFVDDGSAASGAQITVDASSNAGSSYATPTRQRTGSGGSSVGECLADTGSFYQAAGTIRQPSTSGNARLSVNGSSGNGTPAFIYTSETRFNTSAAVNAIRFTNNGSMSSNVTIRLQPISLR